MPIILSISKLHSKMYVATILWISKKIVIQIFYTDTQHTKPWNKQTVCNKQCFEEMLTSVDYNNKKYQVMNVF